jgi:cyclase
MNVCGMRIIPAILVTNRQAYVSNGFRSYCYVGDPLNILSILSDASVDEVGIVDLGASRSNKIDESFLRGLRSLADFPLTYSGGIRNKANVERAFSAGFDRVLISASNRNALDLASVVSRTYGKQAVGISVDYIEDNNDRFLFNPYTRVATDQRLSDFLHKSDFSMASDILLTNTTRTGTAAGFDTDVLSLETLKAISNPLVLSGGGTKFTSRANLSNDLLLKNRNGSRISGICVATSVFLQTLGFGSALVTLQEGRE